MKGIKRTYITTMDEISAARRMRLQGYTYKQIADKYGGTIPCIWRIVNFPTQQEIDNDIILHTRSCIELHDRECLTWKETARRMGLSKSTLLARVKLYGNRELFT